MAVAVVRAVTAAVVVAAAAVERASTTATTVGPLPQPSWSSHL